MVFESVISKILFSSETQGGRAGVRVREGPLPTSSEAGRSAQAELPQAAALLRTATGVFFRSMGGILSDTAFDPE